MQMNTNRKKAVIRSSIAALFGAALATPAMADGLPGMGEDSSPWKTDVFYENHTVYRDHGMGLSKFRNTIQAESDKSLGDGWGFHSVLRGTYDGVYDLNSSKYGNDAGGAVQLQSKNGSGIVNWGHGDVSTGAFHFGFDTVANPNQGLALLGSGWHTNDGGVAFGVPVRPCDADRRGCTDFGGYGNLTKNELSAPEFNSKADFLREAYVKKTFGLSDGTDLFVKVGRQQIVWGRTDLFRVLDVFNPVDYSRNNIYDELQDIRIPLWSAQAEWRLGGSDMMQDRNIQFVWSFDQFRANNLGQCGQPNGVLDAGCFFRGMKNLWDNGGTVQNFAGGGLATDFPAHSIGIRNVNLPKWKDSGSFGLKYEGVSKEGTSFSLNYLTYRSQLPSLHGGKGAYDPFAGTWGSSWPYLIAFDMEFPRIQMIGGSADFQSEALGASFRFEGALTSGEEFANTARPELYSKNNVFRSVIGIDRPMFIPFINPNRTTLISAQLFYQHIFNHEVRDACNNGFGCTKVGMPDWENNVIGTLLIKGFMNGDRVSPQLILARDFQAHAWVAAPQIEWSTSDNVKFTLGANIKGRDGQERYAFDDARNQQPFPALYGGPGGNGSPGPWGGLSGIEPLGRFRAGPIGTAFNQNDLYFMMRYKF